MLCCQRWSTFAWPNFNMATERSSPGIKADQKKSNMYHAGIELVPFDGLPPPVVALIQAQSEVVQTRRGRKLVRGALNVLWVMSPANSSGSANSGKTLNRANTGGRPPWELPLTWAANLCDMASGTPIIFAQSK